MRFLILGLFAISVYSNDLDSLLDNFDETQSLKIENKKSNLTGSYSIYTSYNYALDHSDPHYGLGSFLHSLELDYDKEIDDIRYKLNLNASYDFGTILNSDEYTSSYKEARKDFDIKDMYIATKLSKDIDIKVGRQIVTWGKSDNIIITDVLNPIDKSKIGTLDIKDVKLTKFMTKLDYYYDKYNLSLILSHEKRTPKLAPYGSEYYLANTDIPIEYPKNSIKDTTPAISLNYIGSGYDLSIYVAKYLTDNPYMENGYRKFNTNTMVGFAQNIAINSWLIKTEGAIIDNLKYTNVDDKKKRLDLLAGVEYKGFSDTTLSFEIANRHIIGYESAIHSGIEGSERDEIQTATRVNMDFLNQTLHATYLLSTYGDIDDGCIERLDISYDYRDDIIISGGSVYYYGENKQKFAKLDGNDRVYMKVKWLF